MEISSIWWKSERVELKDYRRDTYQQIPKQQDCKTGTKILDIIVVKLLERKRISQIQSKENKRLFKGATIRVTADVSTEARDGRGKIK